ncbi:MAG TPA: orotate phosphoribosyltransferase [Planctomycetaceae bacterium]|nr:orotate phosphoribosyltransferase [Planctomycetaceae bacterium]
MDLSQRLIQLFHARALQFGEFTLASGQKSTYYLDGKQVTLHSEGLRLVSEGLLDLLADAQFTAIGGMSIGADPIIGGILAVAGARGRDLKGFLVRKEPKGHGTRRYIEGPVEPGEKVVIVDDVATTGGSSLLAAERITEFGCHVVRAVAIVDRLQGAAANFASREIPFRALLTVEAFGVKPE